MKNFIIKNVKLIKILIIFMFINFSSNIYAKDNELSNLINNNYLKYF